MMGIVHAALRRDLMRTRETLHRRPCPVGRQRRALGEHVVWMMDWLYEHHTGEDEGLWPLVRQHNPGAGPLLDAMQADHERITPAAERLTGAGTRYATTTGDQAREDLVTALDELTAVLLPHFDREVAEVMPVVSASITRADWDAHEQRYHINPKSPAELAMEGLWLIDGIEPEGYRLVVGAVSPAKRFVLEHGFGWLYRRRARTRWQPPAARTTPTSEDTPASDQPLSSPARVSPGTPRGSRRQPENNEKPIDSSPP
jgi:hypothetical protein